MRWRSGTCFGLLVVPLVCRSSATSSGAGASRVAAETGPTRGEPRWGARHERHVDESRAAVRRLPRRLELARGDEQRARLEIVEVEGELRRGVGGVQRCGGRPERGDREQQLDELRPGPERQRDAVTPLDPQCREPVCQLVDVARELGVRDRAVVAGGQQGGRTGSAAEQVRQQPVDLVHGSSLVVAGSGRDNNSMMLIFRRDRRTL